ncbi:hypothetical protein DPMN_179667 [Dreissena polymorpha]|uniref:Uncharacterized protein n=1 Tax=Dreissena polymorpha TaxID=45954 RepID=A0A9D4EF68_DREPO|nr:hypothetical protein DPMN_179667 [Dreissena polymorpha]
MPKVAHLRNKETDLFCAAQDVIRKHVLTNFHEEKNDPPPDIFGTNLLTKVFTRKNASPPGSRVFQPTGTIFELFHEDRTINVASRELTRFNYSHNRINALPPGDLVFQATETIFVSGKDFMETNLLTKFHDDRKQNLASRDIIETNLVTKFHEDRKIIVASVVLTRQKTTHDAQRTTDKRRSQKLTCAQFYNDPAKLRLLVYPLLHYNHTRKNVMTPGGRVFLMNRNNGLHIFHDWVNHATSRDGHVSQLTKPFPTNV